MLLQIDKALGHDAWAVVDAAAAAAVVAAVVVVAEFVVVVLVVVVAAAAAAVDFVAPEVACVVSPDESFLDEVSASVQLAFEHSSQLVYLADSDSVVRID